jgi:OPT family oligopeptide transporter
MNIYIGLKIGWSFGSSIISAILGYAIFQLIKPKNPYTLLENNITQTTGSAASAMASAAGLLAPIPALQMMDIELPMSTLFIWSISVAFLGVMFAVPLRKQYVVIENLRFPSGLATANTIKALYSSTADALKKARYLMYFALFAFIYTIVAHYAPQMESPKIHTWLGSGILTTLAFWGFSLYLSPSLFSAGFLIGPKVGISIITGAIVGWTLGYYVKETGWAPHENPMMLHDTATGIWGARGWILWPGVAIMVSEALTSLLLSYKTILNSFKGLGSAIKNKEEEKDEEAIPTKWWIIGLFIASILTISITYLFFDIHPILTIIAIALSFILANVAVRSVGETDINPVGGVGKVTQVVFGSMSSVVSSNLMAAGITGAGASQAADMMQDFKTGHILGASPKQQFKAQLWGIAAGICFAVPVYYLFVASWGIGSEKLPAPAAHSWKAVAEVMSKGIEVLPPFTLNFVIYGAIFGSLLSIINKFLPKIGKFMPSGLAFGISFLIAGKYSLIMFLGTMAWLLWRKLNPKSCEDLAFPVACGMLAGEGLAAIITATITLLS